MKLKIHQFLALFEIFILNGLESNLIASKIFKKITNKQLHSSVVNNYNQSLNTLDLIYCLSLCLLNDYCVLISYNSTECKLYNIIQYQYMIDSPKTILYKKKDNVFDKLNIGLQNYWPIVNENVDDTVGTANMYGGVNVSFTNDRFNTPNSAIDFKNGYYTLPSGEYICGDFTFSLWAYFRPQSLNWNRFFDIGNGNYSDNIVIAYSNGYGSNKIGFHTYNGKSVLQGTISPDPFTVNTWDHYAFVLNGTIGNLYLNNKLIASSPQYVPNCINRTSNFIGKSNFLGDFNADAIFDEIRLYNRALDLSEIQNLMKL